jgi:hypothetical protein
MVPTCRRDFVPSRLPDRRPSRAKVAHREPDWLAVWALSMGVSAAFIAAIAYFSAGDRIGAAWVLLGGAILIAVVLLGSAPPRGPEN